MQRRHLLAGALMALPLLVGGGVGAFAAGAPAAAPARTFLADVAKHLGVSTSRLESAVQQARLDQVRQMLAAGRITPAQAARMEAAIKSGRLGRDFGPGAFGRSHRMPGRPAAMQAAARYLGLTPAELMTQLRSGKSLSEIASATSGKSVQGLVAAITAALQQELQQAAQSGRITEQQRARAERKLPQAVERFVTRAGRRGGAGPRAPRPAPAEQPS